MMGINSNVRKAISTFAVVFLILGIFPETLYLYSKYKDYEKERDLYVANQKEVLDFFQSEVESKFINVFSDLAYLGYSCILDNYLKGEADAATLEENWILFSETNGHYDQIRYLDKNGMEKIRVNLNGGTASAVPADELQNKYDRYYFSMLPKQRNPAIVISPADLNIEHGSIEIPHKPIIRFSLPLYDGDGKFDGALILNYLAENLFVGIQNRFNQEGNQLYVLNQKGYLIAGPDEEQLWGFMFEDRQDMTFSALFGDIVRNRMTETSLTYFNNHGLIIQKSIDPNDEEIDLMLKKLFPAHEAEFMEQGWIIVSLGQKGRSILFNKRLFISLLGSFWMIEIFILLLSGGLSYYVSRLYLKKVRAENSRDALRSIMHEVVNALELTSSMNDDDTGNHIKRVCRYTELLAEEYGLSKYRVDLISEMASLHDIGKISIPDHILKKKGPLDKDEWEKMKTHVTVGYKIVNQLNIDSSARNIVLYHHENWDGSGYMNHLKNEEIPLEARLVSLADVYDALRTERPYKKPFTHEKACAVILKEKGRKFDPEIIDCFLRIEEKFNRISVELADPSEN